MDAVPRKFRNHVLSISPNPSITFKVRYEDPDVLVIDKPPGIVTQPGKGHDYNSLLNGLFAHHGQELQNLGRARDFGLLHRLDKQTSGLLVVALRPRAYDALREAFAGRKVKKFYWAVARSAPAKPSGLIRRPIAEESGDRKTARISSAGKPATTAYRVLEVTPGAAMIECRPITGRLHQVRIHLESVGCPILGDDLYANRAVSAAAKRLALHAHRIVFKHPVSGETIDIHSPWPRDLRSLLTRVRLSRPDLARPGVNRETQPDNAGD